MLIPMFLLMMAQATETAPTPPPDPCGAAEHRQFDFWVGDWDVYDASGKLAGRDVITKEHGGCVVHEQWTGASGMTGSSFNTWERATGRWHQIWVDSTGSLLLLTGGLDGKDMLLEGDMAGKKGPVRHSLRISPLPEGKVRHFWRTSTDGGKTWNVVFNGTFVPHE